MATTITTTTRTAPELRKRIEELKYAVFHFRLETYPMFLVLLIFGGLVYPVGLVLFLKPFKIWL